MAISLISPGVKITEQDLVTSNQSTTSTIGAFSGQFTWGPIEVATQVANEGQLVAEFGSQLQLTLLISCRPQTF